MANMTQSESNQAIHPKSLTEDTVFMRVSFGMVGNTRKVRTESADTAQPSAHGHNAIGVSTDADLSLLKVQKTLLESKKLAEIRKRDGQVREWLTTQSLPYEVGCTIVPLGLLSKVIDVLEAYRTERQDLIEQFMLDYYGLCVEAKSRLGSLYNPADYPMAEVIRSRFTFSYELISFSVPDALKNMSGVYQAEAAKLKEKMQNAADELIGVLRDEFMEKVTHLASQLGSSEEGKGKRLHDSALNKILDFVDTFPHRNIVNDTSLENLVNSVKGMLTGVSMGSIKANSEFKEKVRAKMESVGSQLADLVENAPSRHFRD